MAEWREQVNIGGNGSWGAEWELWGRVREPRNFVLSKLGEDKSKLMKIIYFYFLEIVLGNQFPWTSNCFFFQLWMAAGGWELWERARERRVRKTLLVVGFRR